jgi:hypothetical protein
VFRVSASLVIVAYAIAAPAAQRRAVDACAIEGVQRIVAIGDVHGAYDEFLRILRAAGIIDRRDRWSGGSTYLVQTGDVVDRGADSKKALDLLRRLERDAPKAGGRVLALIGNHETMRLGGADSGNPPGQGFLRDINPAEVDAFRTGRSTELRQVILDEMIQQLRAQAKATGAEFNEREVAAKFEQAFPLGLIEMAQAFSEKGDYGRWIRTHTAAARVNGILFLHGGISARVAPLGCAGINDGVRADLTTGFETFRATPLETLSGADDGPLWYRGLSREGEVSDEEVTRILEAANAKAIVVGHTVTETGRITPRFGGRVVQIDTGMLTSVYKGGRPSALEIVGDKWTAIYEDGRQDVTTQRQASGRAAAR